jgi:hypothetical protein
MALLLKQPSTITSTIKELALHYVFGVAPGQPAYLLVPTLDCSASKRFLVSLPGGLTAAIRREV